jgi:hypothetical protein
MLTDKNGCLNDKAVSQKKSWRYYGTAVYYIHTIWSVVQLLSVSDICGIPTGVVVWDVTLCAGFLVSDVPDNHSAAATLFVLLHVEHEATTIVWHSWNCAPNDALSRT